MKNTIKMSLVAALAVAGLSTTASAGGLEEAIKGVSISGKMEVEYENFEHKVDGVKQDGNANNWDYDFDITVKVPVNDNITAIAGFQADDENDVEDATDSGNFNMPKVYFQYANGPVTAMVGRQTIGAPWFDDARANGVKALYNAGPVTLAAAHFTGVTDDGATSSDINTADISAVAAIGAVGPVNYQVWYANLSGISNTAGTVLNTDADSLVVKLDAKFDIVNVSAMHTTVDYDIDGANDAEAELTKLSVSADFGAVTPYLAYAWTNDDDNGAVARGEGVDLDDDDADTNFGVHNLMLDTLNDADAFLVGAVIPAGKFTINPYLVDGEAKNTQHSSEKTDLQEYGIDVDYQMSKNFKITSYYAASETKTSGVKTEDRNIEIALEYKF